jgi:ABC-type hemin transport system ATPase subunit
MIASGRRCDIGPPEAVMDEAVLESAYGCRVIVDKHPVSRRPTVHLIYPST